MGQFLKDLQAIATDAENAASRRNPPAEPRGGAAYKRMMLEARRAVEQKAPMPNGLQSLTAAELPPIEIRLRGDNPLAQAARW